MMRVESSPLSDAFPKYTTSIPARRSRWVPMRASPPRPLAFSTSTVIAGPRSPGMGRVWEESPPQPAARTTTNTSPGIFTTVRPSGRPTVRRVDSRMPPSRPAMASRSEPAIRFGGAPPPAGRHRARSEHAVRDRRDPAQYVRAPAPESPPDTASVPRHPNRGSRSCGIARRPARRGLAPRRRQPGPPRPAHAPGDREAAHRAVHHAATRRGASGPVPWDRRASPQPSFSGVRRPARYGRAARVTPAPMPANSRCDSRIRADAFTQDDVVDQPRLPDARRHHRDGVGGDAADGLQVLVDQRAVLRDDAGGMHRFQPGALHFHGIRFPAAPGLLEGPQGARQRESRASLVRGEVRVA